MSAVFDRGTIAAMTKRWLIRITAGALLAAGVLYAVYPTKSAPLRDLIHYTLQHGRTRTIPAEAFANLQLPAEEYDVPVRALRVRADGSDHARTFSVRQRGDIVDVLLSDTYSHRGRFYHCTPEGELVSASILGGEKLTKEAARRAFAKELDFWLYYWKKRNEK
jgi:hypothetical protein